MKAVIQRVASASVTVDSNIVSSIGKGILVLAAVSPTDTIEDAKLMVRKLLSLKLWPNAANKPWANSVVDISGEILIVSQFTLYANIGKGSKPDFHGSAAPNVALPFYTNFVEMVRQAYKAESVKDGVFGAMMDVQLINDGPVTFDFDTSKSGTVSSQKAKEEKKKQWSEKKAANKNKAGNEGKEKENATSGPSNGLEQETGEKAENELANAEEAPVAASPSASVGM